MKYVINKEILAQLHYQAITSEMQARAAEIVYRDALKIYWQHKIINIIQSDFNHKKPAECLLKMQDGYERIRIIDISVWTYDFSVRVIFNRKISGNRWGKSNYEYTLNDSFLSRLMKIDEG